MATESDIIQRESGGNPNIGYGGVDLTNAPRDKTGFPIWEGKMGPDGISHAVGLHQWEPATWHEAASALGLTDMSAKSQHEAFNYMHAKYGDAPWAASAPHPEGYYGGALHVTVHPTSDKPLTTPTGNDLLDWLMAQHAPPAEAQKPTGNSLLDRIIGDSIWGSPQQQKPQLELGGALKNLAAIRPPQGPQVVPELQAAQVPTLGPAQLISAPAPARGAPPMVSPPRNDQIIKPPPAVGRPLTPAVPPMDQAPPLQHPIPEYIEPPQNRGTPIAAPKPVIRPTGRPVQASVVPSWLADTGNSLLNTIIKGAHGIVESPAQAAKEQPQSVRQPATAQTSGALDRILSGIGLAPPATTDVQQAQSEQQAAQQPPQPLVGIGDKGQLTGRLADLAEAVTPYLGGAAPGGTTVASSGLRLPGRIEPTIGRAAETPRIEPPTLRTGTEVKIPSREIVSPGSGGSSAGGGEPPIWRGGQAETAGPQPPKGNANESPVVKRMRIDAMNMTNDALYGHYQRQNLQMGQATREFNAYRKANPLTAEEKLQMERLLEWQRGMPQVAVSGKVQRQAEEVMKMRRQAAEYYLWLQKRGATDNFDPALIDEATEGYLHRMRAFHGSEGHPFDPFGRMKSLRRSAPSQQHRTFYAIQDAEGNREPVHIHDGKAPPKPGTPMHETFDASGHKTYQIGEPPAGEKRWEARRATSEEVEKETDVRYLHDPELASFQNMQQLRMARENMEFLDQTLIPALHDEGLEVTDAHDARRMSSVPNRPWRETIIPALHGHYFEPRLADTFDDFYRTPAILNRSFAGATNWIGALNRFGINALFVNPLPHMRNAFWDAALARGDLWWNPASLPGAAKAMKDAFMDTAFIYQRNGKISPFYAEVMKNGGPMMGYNAQSRLMYDALLRRAHRDMTQLPNLDNIAKATGVFPTGKAMVKAMWNQSQKMMWWFHDTLLLQHVRELMQRNPNLTVKQAIQQADRFIADYRVPATVGEDSLKLPQPVARRLSELMQDRSMLAFGRYHYNKLRSIFNVMSDFAKALGPSGMTVPQRASAVARFGSMLLWSTVLAGTVDYILQKLTDNPNANFRLGGAMALPQTTYRVAKDLAYKQSMGDAAYDFTMGLMSIITPMPALMEAGEQLFNRAYPGGPEIAGSQLPGREQAVQRGAHLVGGLVPPVSDILSPRRLLSGVTGLNIPENARPRPPGGYVNRRELKSQQRRFDREFHPPQWLRGKQEDPWAK
jgi:hypothetical protein